MSAIHHHLKCRLEALEDRHLLAVTSTLLPGGTLQITGRLPAEQVRILQNDVDDTLSVSWNEVSDEPLMTLMPPDVFQSSAIKRIVVNLGGGDDDLRYVLESNQLTRPKTISVNLGRGDDYMLLDFGGNLVSAADMLPPEYDDELQLIDYPMAMPAELNANLAIDVHGSVGSDTIDAIFGHINKNLSYRATGLTGNDTLTVLSAGLVAADARTVYDLDGGAGNDQLAVNFGSYGIEVGGRAQVRQRGGVGNDVLNIHAALPVMGTLYYYQQGGAGNDTTEATAQASWMSTGRVLARVLGDASNDLMTLKIKRDPIPPYVALLAALEDMKVAATLNGGGGSNQAWITSNVRATLTQVNLV